MLKKFRHFILMFITAVCLFVLTQKIIIVEENQMLDISEKSTFIFLGITVSVAMISSLVNLRKIEGISQNFSYNNSIIKKTKNVDDTVKKIEFNNNELVDSWKEYLREKRRLERNQYNFSSCDISDYLDVSMLNNIISKNICESIPGVMTGLGVLGTFIGLLLGLRNFDINYESMQYSIMQILEGIKTAFLTSIYGVIYSLLYNFSYRSCYSRMIREYDKFIGNFYSYVVPNTQNEIYSRLISSSESQRDSMKEFVSTIGSLMISEFQKSMDAINDGITEFMSKAIVSQEEKMKILVHEYLSEMNKNIFGGELAQLRDVLNTLNKNELENAKKINNAIEKITDRAGIISDLNFAISNSVRETGSYVVQVEQYQENILKFNEILNSRINDLSGLIFENNKLVENMSDAQHKIYNTVNDFNNTFSKFDARIDNIFDKTELSIKNIETSISENRNNNEKILSEYRNHLEISAENFSNSMKSFSEKHNEDQFRNTSEMIESLGKYTEKYNSEVASIFENINATMKQIEINMQYSYEGIMTASKHISEENSKMTSELCKIIKDFENSYENISTDLKMTNSRLSEISDDIYKNPNEVMNAHNQMIKDLNNSISILKETFDKVTATYKQNDNDIIGVIHDYEKNVNEGSDKAKFEKRYLNKK